MANELEQLLVRLREASFPALGKEVGDFALYDALLVGCADRVVGGEVMSMSDIPIPDEETADFATALRSRNATNDEEREFLAYLALLDQVRIALCRECATDAQVRETLT